MNFTGIIVGLATFLIIGACHPIVIKAEYYFGTKCWWAFVVAGVIFSVLSVITPGTVVSTILGVIAFSSFWGIHELFAQAKRVERGWFPANHKRLKREALKEEQKREKELSNAEKVPAPEKD